MAEAFLKVIIDNLSSLIREEIGVIMGVDQEMQKLSSTLTTIQAVLEDAEDKQIESNPIRDWLRKLNCLAYEIDDILDECATHVSKLKHAGRNLIPNCCTNPATHHTNSIKKIMHRHKIGRRMKQVSAKLDSVAAERAKFHLRELPVDRPREVAAAARETGSMLNVSDEIYGRDVDKEQIVKMLVEDVKENRKMSVLPIIGVGGLGKTTLAQLVFNDLRIVDHFEKRVWVCVSDNFEIKTLVKAMIESATGTGKASDLQHLDALERCLLELLSQKRYLLVLDDVWNDRQQKWLELRDILSCGSAGASIIVTTRQRKVAEIMGTLPPHCLEGLSDEHCWKLLRQCAFGQQEEIFQNLEEIGQEIVKKCAGVPLAAKALGGILRFKREEEEWVYVRESEIWNLPQDKALILPALRLSYHHLPLELRHCFAYFAAFKKDEIIEKEELIHLWMAHGYISARGTLQVEEVGNEVCNELVLRSLLQHTTHVYVHKLDHISMHDLVHDLAQSVMENKVPGMQIETSITSASAIRQVNLLDNYVFFPKRYQQDMDLSSILELKSVRVLDARYSIIEELPSTIGNLVHLRFLNLSGSEIRTLPNSLCTMWNLQTLNLNYCKQLVALPKKMRCLHNLRHLFLERCQSLSVMPPKIGELSGLKTLSMFVVGHDRGNRLEELQCLDLSGRLEIRHLERVEDHLDATKANIAEKKNLRELILQWESNSVSKLREDFDEKVLETLQPHPKLESLTISGFSGRHFPLWMTNSILGNIVEIVIRNCRNCRRLPQLSELPHLKRMQLEDLEVEYIIEDDVENKNSGWTIQFPALERLEITNLPNLKGLSKDQESREGVPNLIQLKMEGCSSLILPPISSLQKLEILRCSSSTLALFSEVDTLRYLTVLIEEKMACFPFDTLLNFRNLESLTIRHAREISVPQQGLQAAFQKLRYLTIMDCKTMTCLPEGLLRHLTALKSLSLGLCPEIVEMSEEIKCLRNLEEMQLFHLPRMTGLPEALQHLSSLTILLITDLPQLDSLPEWLHQLPSLTYLSLVDCAKIASLPRLPNLKHLRIKGCPKLKRRCERGTGEDWHKISHIRRLRIG